VLVARERAVGASRGIGRAIVGEGGEAFAVRARLGEPGDVETLFLGLVRDGGRIINVSSGVTWFAIPEVVYSMSKGALNVLTRSLAPAGPR
jgi:3-oxoacyl-[acyl-carrier protein] reductase